MFCSTQAANLHSRVVDLHKNVIAARASTSTATRRLPMFRSVYGSSNCSLVQSICRPISRLAESESEIGKGNTNTNTNTRRINGDTKRINGADAAQELLKSVMTPFLPPGSDASASVCERKCTPLMPEPKLKPEPEPEPHIFVIYHEKNRSEYFSAYSVGEDGSCISPATAKHYIQPPSLVKDSWCFRPTSCSALLYYRSTGNNDHLLWNPTTNEFKILPPSQNVPLPRRVHHEPKLYRMWYDHGCEDYKLIILVKVSLEDKNKYLPSDFSYHLDLYSLRSNSWKRIPISEDDFGPVGMFDAACINGCFHTLSSPKNIESLLSFNLADETFTISPIPSTIEGLIQILDYKGLVSLLVSPIPCQPPHAEYQLWVLNNESWTMESTFHTCGIRDLLFFSRNGRLLYFATDTREVVVFDRATGELKHPGIFRSTTSCYMPFRCSESFVQLNGDTDVEEQKQKWEKFLKKNTMRSTKEKFKIA